MVAWTLEYAWPVAERYSFSSPGTSAADLLLLSDDESPAKVSSEPERDALPVLRRLVGLGSIVCHLLKDRRELIDADYDDVLDSLGGAFMGECH